jgi:hypothetical protein
MVTVVEIISAVLMFTACVEWSDEERIMNREGWVGEGWWPDLTLSLLMSHICGVSKTFGEWYQKTDRLTLLAFKIIAILHNTLAAIQERVTAVLRSIPTEAFADSFLKLYERCRWYNSIL